MPKLLFVTMLPFYPEAAGGAQHSSLYLFKSLQQLGWQVEVVCGLHLSSPLYRRFLLQSVRRLQVPSFSVVKDEDLGYPCWRRVYKFSKEHHWIQWLDQRLREYQPDVVLGQTRPECPLLNYAASKGYPSFFFVRTLSSIAAGIIPDEIHPIANSPFTAANTAETTHNEVGVVLPFVDLQRYKVKERERRYISFINPIPEKGIAVAIKIARLLPQERFLFVKGKWENYSDKRQAAFMEPLRNLANVEIWEHQRDMSQVYAVSDILLVPSQFPETFGRVILEAQVNGIPVVAAKVGGIPYTLGQGGILVEPKNEPQAYVDALLKLRSDEKLYVQLSALAIENTQRPEFDPHYQVKNFVHFVESRNSAKVAQQEVTLNK